MSTTIAAPLSREELARQGDALYAQAVLPQVTDTDAGKYVVVDVVSGAWEMDRDELAASDRLLARVPDAQVWLRQVGTPYARRFGQRPL